MCREEELEHGENEHELIEEGQYDGDEGAHGEDDDGGNGGVEEHE